MSKSSEQALHQRRYPVIEEMQIKNGTRYNYTPIKIAKVKKTVPNTGRDILCFLLVVGGVRCNNLSFILEVMSQTTGPLKILLMWWSPESS